MSGPYVQFAGFCETVLREQDNVMSMIRVIDRITITAQGPETPEELPPGMVVTNLVVLLKSGDARGRHPVKIRVQQPSGIYGNDQVFDAIFEGDERGIALVVEMRMEVEEGLYWFEVHVGSRRLTKMPLRVIYQRAPRGA